MLRVQVLPGGRLLASSDETGNVAIADLRMLGSTRQPMLWQVGAPHLKHSIARRQAATAWVCPCLQTEHCMVFKAHLGALRLRDCEK